MRRRAETGGEPGSLVRFASMLPGEENEIFHAEPELARGNGDSATFGLLYERHRDQIYWYLRTRTTSDDDAADLVQQTFLRAFDAFGQYQPRKGPVVAWLFGIARNLASNFHRSRRPTIAWDLIPDVLRSAEEDPESAVVRREDLSRLSAAFRQLPPDKRELIVLRFVGGLTGSEIAAVIGKSEAASKKQLSRTVHRLKEFYDDNPG